MPVRNDFAPGEFCWVDLAAHDLPAAAEWYGQLFGWKHVMQETPGGGPPYAFFLHGEGVVGGIGQMSDEMKGMGLPPMWNTYVNTEDCEATEALVKEHGGTVTVPTMDVPGHGRLAFFLDPEGASFATWQTTNPNGPGILLGEPGSVSWNELLTRDTSKAGDFYSKIYGWEYQALPMGDVDYVMAKRGETEIGGLFPMDGAQFEGVPPHWMVYFDVADVDAIAAKVTETGGQVNVPPTEIPIGKFAMLADPQGGNFAVVSVKREDC